MISENHTHSHQDFFLKTDPFDYSFCWYNDFDEVTCWCSMYFTIKIDVPERCHGGCCCWTKTKETFQKLIWNNLYIYAKLVTSFLASSNFLLTSSSTRLDDKRILTNENYFEIKQTFDVVELLHLTHYIVFQVFQSFHDVKRHWKHLILADGFLIVYKLIVMLGIHHVLSKEKSYSIYDYEFFAQWLCTESFTWMRLTCRIFRKN